MEIIEYFFTYIKLLSRECDLDYIKLGYCAYISLPFDKKGKYELLKCVGKHRQQVNVTYTCSVKRHLPMTGISLSIQA